MLYFSDREVRTKLFARVAQAKRPLVVTATRHSPAMRPVPERAPFAEVERAVGAWADQLVVADEGTVEGMWRDPVGDLADRLFPEDRQAAYAAASGYLVIVNGRVVETVKKRGAPEDGWWIQDALTRHVVGVPAPPPRKVVGSKPGANKRAERGPGAATREDTPPRASARAVPPAQIDPWQVLGIAPGTSRKEAQKQFRAQVALYHPDKVAHLGPELRELADKRTREILDAWAQIEPGLFDEEGR